MEDSEIIRLFFARSEEAVRQTEIKYSRYLTVIAFNILGDREDSAECVNDTYLRAWNTMPPENPPRLSLYLGRITRGLSVDMVRRKTALKRVTSEYTLSLDELSECLPSGNTPEQETDASFLAAAISRFLKGCKREARAAFVMRYYFCDSVKEISSALGISESKTKSMLSRTREKLKTYLESEGFM